MGLRHFRGLTRTPRWIPTEEQVLRLFDAVPERYSRGVVARCRARLPDRRDPRPGGLAALHRLPWRRVHVVQQLRYDTAAYGGFLKEPKGGSAGTVSFDKEVQRAVESHLVLLGATEVELADATAHAGAGVALRGCCSPTRRGGRSTIGAGPSTGCGGEMPPAGRLAWDVPRVAALLRDHPAGPRGRPSPARDDGPRSQRDH